MVNSGYNIQSCVKLCVPCASQEKIYTSKVSFVSHTLVCSQTSHPFTQNFPSESNQTWQTALTEAPSVALLSSLRGMRSGKAHEFTFKHSLKDPYLMKCCSRSHQRCILMRTFLFSPSLQRLPLSGRTMLWMGDLLSIRSIRSVLLNAPRQINLWHFSAQSLRYWALFHVWPAGFEFHCNKCPLLSLKWKSRCFWGVFFTA